MSDAKTLSKFIVCVLLLFSCFRLSALESLPFEPENNSTPPIKEVQSGANGNFLVPGIQAGTPISSGALAPTLPMKKTRAGGLELSEKELAWLTSHPVIRVGNEVDYAPYAFYLNGQAVGYSVDYIEMLFKRLGIQAEYVQDNFAGLLNRGKQKEIDLLHTLFRYPPEREQFLLFSQAYKVSVNVIVTRRDESEIAGLADLDGRKVAAVKGDAAISILTKELPEVAILLVENNESALKAVALGKADATVNELAVVNYLSRKLLLNNLHIAAELQARQGTAHNYHLAVRKDWPELASLLNKAMASVKPEELAVLDNRWLAPAVQEQQNGGVTSFGSDKKWRHLVMLTVVLFLVILITLLLFRLLDRSKKNPLAYPFASAGGKQIAVMLNTFLLAIALFLAWWALDNVRGKIEEQVRDSLETVVTTSQEAMNIWATDQINGLQELAASPELLSYVSNQLSFIRRGNRQAAVMVAEKLQLLFTGLQAKGNYTGFFVIAEDGTNLGAMQVSDFGQVNLISRQRPELLQRVFQGEALLVPPIISDVVSAGVANVAGHDYPPTMFFLAPVKDSNGKVIAALAERFNPHGEFARIHYLGRMGTSGETYSFDSQGQLLSKSRFEANLLKNGLLQENTQSILSIEIRDPGGDLIQGFEPVLPVKARPLTRMAKSAIAGETGSDIRSYRDYRGIKVMGAWLWDPVLGIGMTTEIDADEAMEAYYTARLTVFSVLAVMVVISIAFTLFTMVLGSRANRALQLAHDSLEDRVFTRTRELEQALQELASNEQRLQIVVDNVPAAIFFKDALGHHQLVNNMFEQVVGLPQKEVLGKTDLQMFSRDIAERLMKVDRQVMSSGKAVQFEEQGLHESVSAHDFLITKVPILSSENKTLGLVGVALDISKRKQAERQLRQALLDLKEQKFILDQHAIVAVTDLDGNISYVNEKFVEISGYTSDELLGKNHRLLASDQHDQAFWQQMYRTVNAGEVWHNEVCNRAKDGHLYWVEATIATFSSDTGNPRAYVAIHTDISERKRYEAELEQARLQAETANRAKSDFLASMSHEIRTPMNGVLGMLGLLANSPLTTEQQHRVTVAENSAKALLSLINDILDFSKIEAGKIELEELDFDLRHLLEEIALSMAFRADEKSLELLLDVTDIDYSMVIGDQSRLRQIVINLLSNAIKFTHEGEVVITASLEQSGGETLKFICSVRDTGDGIAEDAIAILFDSFTQADVSTTRKYGGTGLGLTICKRLCQQMSGDIRVTSELGKGSCFTFDVLLKPSARSVKVMPKVDISRLNILIVDDNATNREIYRHQLEHWGASVVEAQSGDAALALCRQHQEHLFDIALIDLHMPEMDGKSLAKAIRQQSRFDGMKMILMTSMPESNDHQALYEMGFSGFFSKPVATADLFDALSVVTAEAEISPEHARIVTRAYLDTFGRDHLSAQPLPLWPADTRILLVEDNQVNQLVVQGLLQELSLDCDFAGNGFEAIAGLRESPQDAAYTLIFMDCQMPELDGYETTRRIRRGKAGERYLKVPVIAMTANAMKGDREKCLNAGMDDYLTKPLAREAIVQALCRWLSVENREDNALGELQGGLAVSGAEVVCSRKLPEKILLHLPPGLNAVDFNHKRPEAVESPEIYLKALSLYVRQGQEVLEQLAGDAARAPVEGIEKIIHAVKGTSGNLGMYLVYEQALALEQMIVESGSLELAAFEQFCHLLQQSLGDARKILQLNEVEKGNIQVRDYQEVKQLLIDLLTKSELIPESLLLEFRAGAGQHLNAEMLTLITDALDNFDYEEALTLLMKQS
ncbi:response regulator [Thalassomonas actiniarum]|uniref:Sensory/regulatory protein RpfC n=1 Tax=Thalassomonas actiniarum TaxID=485447 RepID=A0AAE9YVH7_9GAMM|nr:response regulator [Thalassomonas actiniarum]WDE01099.1 response regulator [Thalassomonas actiniarum]